MHIVRIAAWALLAIGSIMAMGLIVVIGIGAFTGKLGVLLDDVNSTRGLRFLLGFFIIVVCITSANNILTFKAPDVSSSAISVALLALLGLAVDFYSHGKIYLTGDFGPLSSAMLLCACLLAAASDDYKRHRLEVQQKSGAA